MLIFQGGSSFNQGFSCFPWAFGKPGIPSLGILPVRIEARRSVPCKDLDVG